MTTIAANFTSDNASVYKADVKSGALTQVAGSPFAAGTNPFGVVLSQNHTPLLFAYVTNHGSDNVSAYRVNAKSGALTAVTGSPFGACTEPFGVADGGPHDVCGSGK
jgi:6-phosphogluconolactonase (cycloisomerase 2 family)